MSGYADLEIGLHKHNGAGYAVDFRYIQPDSDADIRLGQVGNQPQASFNISELLSLSFDPIQYGEALTSQLFSDEGVKSSFAQVVASTQSLNTPLRIRLLVGPSAPELHALLWETLRHPLDGSPLCTNQNILFSRYLSSLDWRPVRLRPKEQLKALVVVSNPSNLSNFKLDPVDVPGELNRALTSLVDFQTLTLPDQAGILKPTINNIVQLLQAETIDILYLVCHGVYAKEESWIWLEDEEGKAARISGTELVTRMRELPRGPRLVVLASCQSAGKEISTASPEFSGISGGPLAALGPRLAEAGIPAVIAMQGNISMQTVSEFMPVFFKELQQDGQIDRAMSAARGAVRNRPDYWLPALFMRLKSGRVWYVPGFSDDRQGFEKWPALMKRIVKGQCTPIIGPGLIEPLLGSLREIARRWAERYHYPLAPHERESLPQVAQYLAINQDSSFPLDELEEYLKQEIRTQYCDDLPVELQAKSSPLNKMVDAIGSKRWANNPSDPHRVLAQLPLPIYITTNVDNLLVAALKESGRDPQVMICPWNEYIEQYETIYDREPDYHPTVARPLVYHLFGRLDEPDSIVLTEDNYFKFLIGVTGNKDLIPSAVRRALADTALLFLGFQMDEWNFRVLFHGILSQQGSSRRDRYSHIAAQIEPEEGRILEPERARRYLESYYFNDAYISIFWGSAEDFVNELWKNWNLNNT
jgi:hypothetical protein